jgi:hypothetical protein
MIHHYSYQKWRQIDTDIGSVPVGKILLAKLLYVKCISMRCYVARHFEMTRLSTSSGSKNVSQDHTIGMGKKTTAVSEAYF